MSSRFSCGHVASPARRGAAFIIALLVVTVIASVVLIFAQRMQGSAEASRSAASQAEARWVVMGALEAVRGDLADVMGDGEAPRLVNVGAEAVQIGGGLYWIIGRAGEAGDSPEDVAFGLVSEAGKLNLNEASADSLIELPDMTESLAGAVTDWINSESQAQVSSSRRSPMESVDELMLVPGFTAELIDGEDANRNGVLDPNEDDGDASAPDDNGDGRLDRGLRDFVTVYSSEPNTSDEGEARIFLNQGGQGLGAVLREVADDERFQVLAGTIPPQRPFANTLDFYLRGQLTEEEFAGLHDKVTVDRSETLTGRVDLYHAPAEVIEALPGFDAGDGDVVVNGRPTLESSETPGDFAWLIELVGEEKAVAAGASLTHRSLQFTADIVGVSSDGHGFCRMRFVLDCGPVVQGQATLPVVRHVQDLTALGWPLEPVILESLRSGSGVTETVSLYGETGL